MDIGIWIHAFITYTVLSNIFKSIISHEILIKNKFHSICCALNLNVGLLIGM